MTPVALGVMVTLQGTLWGALGGTRAVQAAWRGAALLQQRVVLLLPVA